MLASVYVTCLPCTPLRHPPDGMRRNFALSTTPVMFDNVPSTSGSESFYVVLRSAGDESLSWETLQMYATAADWCYGDDDVDVSRRDGMSWL